MKHVGWLEFALDTVALRQPVRIRLVDSDDRWAARVEYGAASTSGIGATAREALVNALAPFGARAVATVMAQPEMFAASARLRAAAM